MHLSDWWQGRYAVRGECWIWTGPVGSHGYGTIGRDLAHRRSYREARGPIPAGAHVHHTCESALCVRPDHLAALAPGEHGRTHSPHTGKTHCCNGHAFTPENTTILRRRGGEERRCRRCHREREARRVTS